MPIYEYKCSECEAHFEKMQKVSDQPLTVCEVCGGNLEKQWSLSGFQFKGAGWYVHEYSNKLKDPNAAKSDKTAAAKVSDKSEKTEKSSAAESTAKTETASNTTSETKTGSKKETTAKKD